MSLRFAEMMNSFSTINKISYSDFLVVDLTIVGCLTLDSLNVNDFKFSFISTSYNPNYNSHDIKLKINNNREDIPQLNIIYQCDQKWGKEFHGKEPHSHFVLMKTQPKYYRSNNGYEIFS